MKKLLVLLLLVVTVITLAVPAPALARNDRSTETAFVAFATVAVTDPGITSVPDQVGHSSVWKMSTDYEIVQGQITSAPRWSIIEGAYISIEHHSTIYLNYRTQRFTGSAQDIIQVTNGSTVYMAGSYSALLSGSFTAGGAGEIPTAYDHVIDAAKWDLSGVAGAPVTASGAGLARLDWTYIPEWGVSTLAGPLLLTGVYK